MEVLAMPAIPHFPENYGNSVPTSPRRFVDSPFDFHNHYTSAPTSPTRAAAIYAHFNSITAKAVTKQVNSTTSHVPFGWEVVPGTPKSCSSVADEETDTEEEELDFSFDLSRQFANKQGIVPAIITADELFEEGKIRPLKLPPRLQYPSVDTGSSLASSPRTPKSPVTRGLFSPCNRGRRGGVEGEFDPFIAAMVEATRDPNSRSRKASRSLSPFRGRSFFSRDSKEKANSDSSSSDTKSSSKKWRLKDLLLFRSVSEGRGTGERTSLLSTTTSNHSRNGSFQSKDGTMSSMLQNENRYVQRRVVLGEFNKKSSLAYRHSLFGCLRINNLCKRT